MFFGDGLFQMQRQYVILIVQNRDLRSMVRGILDLVIVCYTIEEGYHGT
jgi:hypothetical protein